MNFYDGTIMYSKFDITTAKYGEVLEMKRYDLAILPWGSTEPHKSLVEPYRGAFSIL